MTRESTHLIETAIRPFRDNAKMALPATQLLVEMSTDETGDADVLTTRWNEVDSKRSPHLVRRLLLTFLLIASATILTVETKKLGDFVRFYTGLNGSNSLPFRKLEKLTLSSEQRLLLYGDESKHSEPEKAKTLWDLHPENPAYFSEYAAAYLQEYDNLPPDFLEVAHKIAPKNSWFLYLAANDVANKAVKRKPLSLDAKAAHQTPDWEILKPAQLDRAMQLFHQARDLPEFDDYKAGMMRKKISLLKQRNKFERLASTCYLMGLRLTDIIKIRMLGDAIAARFRELARENKTAEFESLIADTEAYDRKSLSVEPSTLIAGLVTKVNIEVSSQALAAGAKKLGLLTESTKYQAIYDTINYDRKKVKPIVKIDGVEFQRKSGYLDGMVNPSLQSQVNHPPAITDADVKPNRMLDYENLSMLCTVISFFLLGIVLIFVWAFRLRQGKCVRQLAQRMESSLSPADWAWIMVAGIMSPFAWVAGLTYLTPLGDQDLSVSGLNFVLPTAQFAALVFLLVISPVVIVRWRLEKRLVLFGFKSKQPWLGWAAVTSAAIYVIIIGIVAREESTTLTRIASLLLLFPMLWIFTTGFCALISRRVKLLKSATIARSLIPAYATAMLMMISLVPAFNAAEQYWFAHDSLMMLDAARPGTGTYEYRVAVELQKETRELLGMEP